MKILYIFNFPERGEYLADMIYHGLSETNHEVHCTHHGRYMLKENVQLARQTHGLGFSIRAKMDESLPVKTPEEISDNIACKYYDTVIYGCAYSKGTSTKAYLIHLDEVKQKYGKNDIHFVDGCDRQGDYCAPYYDVGTVWKREIVGTVKANPIGYAIPRSMVLDVIPEKTQSLPKFPAPLENSGGSTHYTYRNETQYHEQIAKSRYAITCKKAGWDCMRHYEIIANRTLPTFTNIEKCPPRTMVDFPKDMCYEINHGTYDYDEMNERMYLHTLEYLTTERMVQRFL